MSLRKVVCSHCFREVFVGPDEICPACRKNTAKGGYFVEDFQQVEFVDGESLPPRCLVCGEAGETYVIVGERNENKSKDKVYFISRLAAALGGLIAIKINPESEIKEYKISVRIPVCKSHIESRMLVPLHVDYSRFKITLPAHHRFVEEWRLAKR
jgi:hypothetical protein